MTRTIWTCLFVLLLATSLLYQSVQQFESKPPSAEELLALDPQADLFQWKKRSIKQM
ncbi:hypothetical protein ACEQPO_02860 [Bacillus sp. SL00103]